MHAAHTLASSSCTCASGRHTTFLLDSSGLVPCVHACTILTPRRMRMHEEDNQHPMPELSWRGFVSVG